MKNYFNSIISISVIELSKYIENVTMMGDIFAVSIQILIGGFTLVKLFTELKTKFTKKDK